MSAITDKPNAVEGDSNRLASRFSPQPCSFCTSGLNFKFITSLKGRENLACIYITVHLEIRAAWAQIHECMWLLYTLKQEACASVAC